MTQPILLSRHAALAAGVAAAFPIRTVGAASLAAATQRALGWDLRT